MSHGWSAFHQSVSNGGHCLSSNRTPGPRSLFAHDDGNITPEHVLARGVDSLADNKTQQPLTARQTSKQPIIAIIKHKKHTHTHTFAVNRAPSCPFACFVFFSAFFQPHQPQRLLHLRKKKLEQYGEKENTAKSATLEQSTKKLRRQQNEQRSHGRVGRFAHAKSPRGRASERKRRNKRGSTNERTKQQCAQEAWSLLQHPRRRRWRLSRKSTPRTTTIAVCSAVVDAGLPALFHLKIV